MEECDKVIGVDPGSSESHKRFFGSRTATLALRHMVGTESDPEFKRYHPGNAEGDGFGHIAFAVDDVYESCQELELLHGVAFKKRPDEGRMKGLAFVLDPDGRLRQHQLTDCLLGDSEFCRILDRDCVA
jgi:lactoylglutathione lyase